MCNLHWLEQVVCREQSLTNLENEGRAPEVGVAAWPYPQTVRIGETEEGERWDGLS